MLNLFQSNQMEALAGIFCERAAAQGQMEGADPFTPLTIIVQNFGMGQWLKMRLAAHGGIAANVRALLPAQFLWQLYRGLVADARPHSESPFARERLAFRIMRLLKGPALAPAVTRYLQGDGDEDLRRYQLSDKLAGLFDQYLVYRPGWMQDWRAPATGTKREARPHEAWQRELWRRLLADLPAAERHLDRASLHQKAMAALKQGKPLDPSLPQAITVFGLSTMPPMQLEALQALGERAQVDLYFLNPCEHYWGDLVSQKDKARRSVRSLLKDKGEGRALADDDYLELGNPILSSLGKQGREFFEMLTEVDGIQSIERFAAPTEDTALAWVKQDILGLAFGGVFGAGASPEPRPLPEPDSLQVHICHSRLREVETLRDRLLHLIAKRPDITLSDIIVMAPDMASYAPLVQAVFGDPLHYRISDRSHPEESPLLASFLQLLALPHSRFTAAEVLDLLESPAVARRFALSEADLALVAVWVRELAIRWELDGKAKADHWQLPPASGNTWRFGMDRLLLGFARAASQGVWQGMLAQEISPQEAELVAKLAAILERLGRCRQELSDARPLADWRRLAQALLDDFFDPREEEVLEAERIREALDALATAGEAAACAEALSFSLFRHLMATQLDRPQTGAAFLSGGITFATLVPMRSIPFKVVCLLGLNDRDYPRDRHPLSFDLMQGQHQKGDRSRKLDDRYLFLEALLSAQEVFYLSYVGRGVRDNEPKPPSVVVAEWRAYLEAIFTGFAPMEHPLQPFSPRLYAGDARQSFSPVWQRSQAGRREEPPFIAQPLPPDPALAPSSAAQVSRFLAHSARHFLQQRLGVYFEQEALELGDAEPFSLDPLARYQLADRALAALVAGQGLDAWQETQLATGRVMPGDLGRAQLAGPLDLAQRIHATVAKYAQGEPRQIAGDWQDGEDSLHYRLDGIHGDWLLDYRAGAIRARHLLAAYLRHLLAGAAGETLATLCIGRDGDQVAELSFRPLPAGDCHERLRQLTRLYREGSCKPLLLAPELCRSYAQALIDGGDEEAALAKAAAGWQKDRQRSQAGSEAMDSYWTRLFTVPEDLNAEFAANARQVWLPLLDTLGEQP